MPNNEKKTYRFLMSGFTNGEHTGLVEKIQQLGGVFYESSCFKSCATHLICRKLSRSEKFLSACASGKWVLTPQFIEDSYKKKKWQTEEQYEWNVGLLSPCISSQFLKDLYSAPRRHRRSKHMIFQNWNVVFYKVNRSKQAVYKRMVQAGGGEVTSFILPMLYDKKLKTSFTHMFVDDSKRKGVDELLKAQILCIHTDFIRNCILRDTSPDPNDFKLPHYIPNTDPYFSIGLKSTAVMNISCQSENGGTITRDLEILWSSSPRHKSLVPVVSPIEKDKSILTQLKRPLRTILSPKREQSTHRKRIKRETKNDPSKRQLLRNGTLDSFVTRLPVVKLDLLPRCVLVGDQMSTAINSVEKHTNNFPLATANGLCSTVVKKHSSNCVHRTPHGRSPKVEAKRNNLPDTLIKSDNNKTVRILFGDNEHNSAKKQKGLTVERNSLSARVKPTKKHLEKISSSVHLQCPPKSLPPVVMSDSKITKPSSCLLTNLRAKLSKLAVVETHSEFSNKSVPELSNSVCAHVVSTVDKMKTEKYLEHWNRMLPSLNKTTRKATEAPDYSRSAFQSFSEDEEWLSAVYEVTEVTTWSYYPAPSTVQDLIIQMILNAPSLTVVYAASEALTDILTLHPPSTYAMRQFYLKVLNMNELTHPWVFISDIVRDCTAFAFEFNLTALQEKHFISRISLLEFFQKLFELDFAYFVTSSQNPAEDLSLAKRQPIFVQLLWGIGKPKTITPNCHRLLKIFIHGVKCDGMYRVLSAVRKLVFYLFEYCRLSESKTVSNSKRPGASAFTLAQALAAIILQENLNEKQIAVVLECLDLSWVKLIVTELLLDVMGNSKSSSNDSYAVTPTCLHKIATHFMALVPSASVLEENVANTHSASLSLCVSSTVLATPQKPKRKHDRSSTSISPRFSVNKRNVKGETPLHLACIRNNVDRVRQLLSTPRIDVNARDNCDWTPLHEACNHGHVECVVELLKFRPLKTIDAYFSKGQPTKQGIDVTAQAFNNITPLHDAVSGNHIEIAKALLKFGGLGLLEARNSDGETPLDVATSTKMKVLLKEFQTRLNNDAFESSSNSVNHNATFFSRNNLERYITLVRHLVPSYLDVHYTREIWSHMVSYDFSSPNNDDCSLSEVQRLDVVNDLKTYSDIYSCMSDFEEHILQDCHDALFDVIWFKMTSLHLLVLLA